MEEISDRRRDICNDEILPCCAHIVLGQLGLETARKLLRQRHEHDAETLWAINGQLAGPPST